MAPSELAHNHVAVIGSVDVADPHGVVPAALVVGQLLLLVGEDALERDGRRGRGRRLQVRGGAGRRLVPARVRVSSGRVRVRGVNRDRGGGGAAVTGAGRRGAGAGAGQVGSAT